jgi:hypothetical protein
LEKSIVHLQNLEKQRQVTVDKKGLSKGWKIALWGTGITGGLVLLGAIVNQIRKDKVDGEE